MNLNIGRKIIFFLLGANAITELGRVLLVSHAHKLSMEGELKHEDEPFRVLEFYSGIGGMRFSLQQSGIHAKVVEAFDINNIANEVYKHNFGHSPYQGNIQSLTAAQLDKFRANAWLLSPPCQPYTRQGLQKDAEDARASSFMKILELISLTLFPPTMLFVENVVGFESSITHTRMMEVLKKIGFITQEFILSPLQFSVPYSRPRYFCLAKKATLSFPRPEFNGKLVTNIGPLISGEDDNLLKDKDSLNGTFQCKMENVNEVELDTNSSCRPIKDFLQPDIVRSNRFGCTEMNSSTTSLEIIDTKEARDESEDHHAKRGHCRIDEKEVLDFSRDFTGQTDCDYVGVITENRSNIPFESKDPCGNSEWDQFRVPPGLIERWGDAMDIVFPNSKRCCCFTKSYGRYVKGTGSLLATSKDTLNNPFINVYNWRQASKDKVSLLQELDLRYFTPHEIANLHSFPEDFSFPSHVSSRQRYALLGNSLSVAVVAPLLKYLFTE